MTTFISKHGNLLESDAQALVNTVNCVGVMGKGLALQFKQQYPSLDIWYQQDCERGMYWPGAAPLYAPLEPPYHWVFCLATKDHWRSPSRIEWVEEGLARLLTALHTHSITSIAIPPLGCGLGGLNWKRQVLPLVLDYLQGIPNLTVYLYEPAR